MKATAQQMEEQAVLATAARMCAAARTAPKAKGIDRIVTLVLTGAEKDALADKMHEVARREFGDAPSTFHRDAGKPARRRGRCADRLEADAARPGLLLAVRLCKLCRACREGSRRALLL